MKVMLNVLDLDDAIEFYTKRRDETSWEKIQCKQSTKVANFVGYVSSGETENDKPYIELIYKYAQDKINVGSCLNGISIEGCDREAAILAGGTLDEGAADSSVRDITGYPLRFV